MARKTWRVRAVEDEKLETGIAILRTRDELIKELEDQAVEQRTALKADVLALIQDDVEVTKLRVGGQAAEITRMKRRTLSREKLLSAGVKPEVLEACTEETEVVSVKFVEWKE